MHIDDVNLLIVESIPFLKRFSLTLVELSPSNARVHLPFDAGNANHAGSLHAGALFTIAETAALALGLVLLDNVEVTCTTKSVEMRLRKPGRGDVWASAQIGAEAPRGLLEHLTAEGKLDVPVLVELTDAASERMADATITLTLRRR